MQAHFIEIHEVFGKKKVGYFSNRVVYKPRLKESTEVRITQNKGKKNENQKLKRSWCTGTRKQN
jgi:hypothetical protein